MIRLMYGVDVMEGLKTVPDESVDCCVTSPPYWGLRCYGVDGQSGLESSPDHFVEKMVEVFREVRRTLKPEGTLWLNIGDSYAGRAGGFQGKNGDRASRTFTAKIKIRKGADGLKPKDLVGIPWMLAFALRADGWFLRQDIIWSKPNPMPESVRDRCTKAHEYIFLLSKSAKYFYNQQAIKEPATWGVPNSPGSIKSPHRQGFTRRAKETMSKPSGWDTGGGSHNRLSGRYENSGERVDRTKHRNKRSVWNMATTPYKEAHFATFPKELPKICIQAGTMPGGLVLDPFSGSGTTGEVALNLGRHYIGIDINKEYLTMAVKRIGGLFTEGA